MTEEEKQTSLSEPAPSSVAADAVKNDDPQPAPVQEMSKGEKWFNRLVYSGLNYWANLAISLVITDFFLHGKGKDFFSKSVNALAGKVTASGLLKRPNAKWVSEIFLGSFSLNSGGNILLVPTKFLEDNKRPIVHWLNEKMGVDQTAPDGHKKTPDEIYIEQQQDPQSWLRMIGRRLLGLIATTSTGLTIDKFFAKKLSVPQRVDGEMMTHTPGQKVFTDTTLKYVNYGLNSGYVPGGKQIAASPGAQRYMGYAALDWIYTIITSKILHATNGAYKQKMPHETDGITIAANTKMDNGSHPEEEKKQIIVPAEKHAAAGIIQHKKKDESFAAAASRQSETAGSYQLGA